MTPYAFATRFLRLVSATEWEQIYTHYLLELALIEYPMVKYKASELAATAVCLTLKLSPKRSYQPGEHWVQFVV